MNASHRAESAYAPGNAANKPARAVEYDAFAKITGAMKRAASVAEKASALHQNRQLWTLLAVDVSGDGNRLPNALRAQIFYLAEFTNHHTSKVLAGKAEVDALIDINTAIMRGLRPQNELAS